MTNFLSSNDIEQSVRQKVYTQEYTSKKKIDGVQILSIKNFAGEDGDFCELMRLDKKGEMENFPGFKLAQVNRSKLFDGALKGWHLHYKQDELWYVGPSHQLFVGLWDVREHSPTKNVSMRITLGSTNSQLLYIPHGVAHGCANHSGKSVELIYFMNQQFNLQDLDEHRIPWHALDKDFWSIQRD